MWVYVVLLRESVVCSWGTGGPYELYYRDCLTFIVKLPPHLPAFQKNIYGGHVRAIYIHGCHVRAVYKDMWSFALNIHDGRVRAIYTYVHTWWSCARNIYIHGGDMRAVYKLCVVRARDHHRTKQTPPPFLSPHLPYTQTHVVYLKWFGVQRKVHSHCVG